MHPRTQIRSDIRAAIEPSVPGVSVYTSHARKLPPSEQRAVLIYTTDENISQVSRGSERAGRGVISRDVSVEIVALAQEPGAGDESAEAADDLSRIVEQTLSAFSDLKLGGTKTEFGTGATTECVVTMSYTMNHIDDINAE